MVYSNANLGPVLYILDFDVIRYTYVDLWLTFDLIIGMQYRLSDFDPSNSNPWLLPLHHVVRLRQYASDHFTITFVILSPPFRPLGSAERGRPNKYSQMVSGWESWAGITTKVICTTAQVGRPRTQFPQQLATHDLYLQAGWVIVVSSKKHHAKQQQQLYLNSHLVQHWDHRARLVHSRLAVYDRASVQCSSDI